MKASCVVWKYKAQNTGSNAVQGLSLAHILSMKGGADQATRLCFYKVYCNLHRINNYHSKQLTESWNFIV